MSWFGTAEKPSKKTPSSSEPFSSLEYPTTVHARGIQPANAVVEQMTAAECRLRSVVLLDHGEVLEFDFGLPGQPAVHARGHVLSRTGNGPRFTYRIRLDRMNARETDDLARTVAEAHRRQARARAQSRAIQKLPTTEEGLTRNSMRVLAQFPIFYRTAKGDAKAAKAGDVSSGGLSMICSEALVAGETIELRFTLPSEALDIHPEQTAILDLRNRSVRHVQSDLRRSFEEMVLRARVVTHLPVASRTYKYGVAFLDMNDFLREELARYVHAVQLAKRRTTR